MFVFAQPLHYDTRSILKQITAGLNLEFIFSKTNCGTKVKELSLFIGEKQLDSYLLQGY